MAEEQQVREPEQPEEPQGPEAPQEPKASVPEPVAKPVFKMGTLKCKGSPVLFKSILNCIGPLEDVEVVPFYFSETGLIVRTMNGSHNRMLDAEITADDFDEYSCEGEVRLGLRMTRAKGGSNAPPGIDKYVARATESFGLEVVSGELNAIAESKTRKTTFLLHFNEAPSLSRMPKIVFDVKLKMDRVGISEAIKDALLISKNATFNAENNAITIKAVGDAGKSESRFGEGSMFPVDIAIGKPSISSYDIEVFDNMVAALGAEEVIFEFSHNMPCKLVSNVIEENDMVGTSKIAYYLAPRIESDSELTSAKKRAKEAVKKAEDTEQKEQEAAEQ